MDAIASSRSPLARTVTGPESIKGRRYFDILTDMTDQFAWGQYDHGSVGGGWRYGWNTHPDNSAAQWGAIGMQAAQDIFGIPVPQWVKDRNNVWLNYSYNGTGFGYNHKGNGRAQTPSGMVQLAFDDKDTNDKRWQTAESYIAAKWSETDTASIIYRWWNDTYGWSRDYYAMYAFTKAMRLANPEPVIALRGTELDWFDDPDQGLARMLINDQEASGRFSGDNWTRWDMRTAWAIIMLSRTLFVQPPVADAGRDRVWSVDLPFTFDGSGSYHLDPFRDIVEYEWDFDGDGVFDYAGSNPTAVHTHRSADYPKSTLPQTIRATLRVTDNNVPPLTAVDTMKVIIAVPPHPPVADANGPYTCTAGLPCALDGSGSFDIDPTDFIARYEWELDRVFPYDFDEAGGSAPSYVWASPGLYNVGLRVWDNGVLNDLDGDGDLDENERLSDQVFTTAMVAANLAPTADAGGPYTVNEGSGIRLTGSGTDPNGDPLTYQWDLDNDGDFDDATGENPDYKGVDDGVFTVGLRVTDGLLDGTDTSTVTVNNVVPLADAGPDAAIDEGDTFSSTGSFSDPGADTWTATVVYGEGAGPQSLVLNPDRTFGLDNLYEDNGIYTVTVTVTDDDGGMGSDAATVRVSNVAPAVEAGLDQDVLAEDPVALNGSFADPGLLDTHTAEIDWGDGTVEPGNLTQAADSGAVAGFHAYAAAGSYTVTLSVTDNDGGTGSDTLTATVQPRNLPPSAGAGGPYTVDEGGTVALDSSGSSDPDGDPLAFAWDLDDDGQFDDSTDSSPVFSGSDDGTFTVGLQVSDDSLLTDTASATVMVNNIAPAVDAGPDVAVDEGGTYTSAGSFTDPGTDTWTATVDYGEGAGPQPLALNPDRTFALDYRYKDNGAYTVTVTVTDDDGGVGSDTVVVTVNPGGLVRLPECIADLMARPKDSKVQIVWTHQNNAESYNVYRSTTADVEISAANRIMEGLVTTYATYLDLNVVNRTTYYYKVTKEVGGVENCRSNEASATPQTRKRTR